MRRMLGRSLMLQRHIISRFASDEVPKKLTRAELREQYRRNPARLIDWTDHSILNVDGKAFPADEKLLSIDESFQFPKIEGWNLDDVATECPSDNQHLQLVGLSLKGVGFDFVVSWTGPFSAKFADTPKVQIHDIIMHEYAFLKYFRGVYARNLKGVVPLDTQMRIKQSFGDTYRIAEALLLQNKYSGYVFLLDRQKRVRWRGCGLATAKELDSLYRCAENLLK